MQQFDSRRDSARKLGLIVAAGTRDGEAQPRPDAGAAGKYGIAHRGVQTGRSVRCVCQPQCLAQGSLYILDRVHEGSQ
jgi:hypothetical protein